MLGVCGRELVKLVRKLGEDNYEEVKIREKRKSFLFFFKVLGYEDR